MLVAAFLLAAGFLAVASVTQARGLRLGGAIVVPVLALYTLKNFVALPVFLVSFCLAFVALWAAKRYTLAYGRTELVVAIVAGSLLPLAALFFGHYVGLERVIDLRASLFLGSVLPGMAAYNVQQLKPGYRRQDTAHAVGIYLALLALGVLLVSPRLAPVLGAHTPPVLYAATSDVAVLRGAVVEATLYPTLLERTTAVGLLVVAFLVAEWGRSQFGLRAGVVTMGLVAVYATASRWLAVLFLLDLAAAAVAIGAVHRATLLYGRVLIGVGSATAVAVTVPLALALPVVRGLSAVFVAVLAGSAAYNHHVTAPRERRMRLPLLLLVFAPAFALAHALGTSYATGLLAGVAVRWVTLGAALLAAACYLLLRRFEVAQPSDEDVLSASVLSGGEG